MVGAQQMKLAAVEQFPLNFFAWLQADRGGQGERETDIEPGLLSARTNRLDPQRIGRGHGLIGCPPIKCER